MKDKAEINSMGEASAAVAEYQPPELYGLTVRKVGWTKLPGLIETFNEQVLAAIKSYTGDDGGDVDPAAVLTGLYEFANRLLTLSCGITSQDLDELKLDWDAGAKLFAHALRVNLRDLSEVVSFFSGALSGVINVSPGSASTPVSAPSAEDGD